MTTNELRAKLTAEKDALDVRAKQLSMRMDEAEEKYKAIRNEWYPVYLRFSDLEKRIESLDALAEQLEPVETKSPGSDTGATENTTAERMEP